MAVRNIMFLTGNPCKQRAHLGDGMPVRALMGAAPVAAAFVQI